MTNAAESELVTFLREKLAQAERGEIASMAYAVQYANGAVGVDIVGSRGNVIALAGSTSMLHARVTMEHLHSEMHADGASRLARLMARDLEASKRTLRHVPDFSSTEGK